MALTEVGLDDRLAITELLSKYGLLLDRRQVEAWVELFEPDATVEIDGRPPINSTEGLVDLATNSPQGLHMSASPIIARGSLSKATRVEQSFVFHNLGTGQVRAGWYEDVVIKREGRWRFSQRAIRFLEVS